jgi:hypothetical protein
MSRKALWIQAKVIVHKSQTRAWDIGGGAKLWEWCANRTAGIFPYLLRKSNEGGGGDVHLDNPKFAGRWAGDKVLTIPMLHFSEHSCTLLTYTP